MFMVNAEIVEAVRTTFHTKGEWAAAVELRRLYPGIRDNKAALEAVRLILGWTPEQKEGG